ncbi:MAG TPA: 4Fe-4S dicluster domain-containing protein [Rhodoblastus sp.]|nr:4Fe-4S dicluster domain-containing protein [Rhodoblastus sp.]
MARVARIGPACVEPRGVACRRCGEACDIGAIRFRLQRGGAQPLLDISACTGCGDCLAVCPTSAIAFVDGARALVATGLAEDFAMEAKA